MADLIAISTEDKSTSVFESRKVSLRGRPNKQKDDTLKSYLADKHTSSR